MLHNNGWRSTARMCFCLRVSLLAATTARAQCTAPPYFPVRDFVNPQLGAGLVHIWIPPSEFTLTRIVCLVQTLNNQHPRWNNIVVLLFSSEEAAEYFDAGGMSDFLDVFDLTGKLLRVENIGRFRRELRGVYVLDVDKHEHQLVITPLGLNGGELYETRIELPVTGTPHCRLELSNRCVLALEPIKFRDEALGARVSGTVTLTGQIRRDGTVTDIRVANANSVGFQKNGTLVFQNLSPLSCSLA